MRVLALSSLFLASSLGAETYLPRFSQVVPGIGYDTDWTIHDVDGDGLPDLTGLPESGYASRMGSVLRNLGNRSFAPPVISHMVESRMENIDSDNFLIQLDDSPELEIFFCQVNNQTYRSVPVMVKFGKPGQYGQRIPLAPESDEFWDPIDLDADGRTEFLASSSGESITHLTLWERGQDGNYVSQQLPFDGEIESFSYASVSDLDKDGDLDLVLSKYDDIRIIERTGFRTFASVTEPLDSDRLSHPGLTDLDGDGLPDMHSTSSSYFYWRTNLGGFSFGNLKTLQSIRPELEDWDLLKIEATEGNPAIIHLSKTEDSIVHLKSIRFGTWEVISDLTLSGASLNLEDESGLSLVELKDLDKDGYLDLFFVGSAKPSTKALPYNSNFLRLGVAWGTSVGFEPPAFIDPVPLTHERTLVDDFNGDSSKDLIVGPDAMGRFVFLPNTGDGTFGPPEILGAIAPPAGSPSGTYISAIHAADFNDDSIPDLAVDYAAPVLDYYHNYYTASGIALGNGDGTFAPPTLPAGSFDTITDGALNITQLIDWDRDGDLDAISGRMLRQNLGGYFSPEVLPLIEGGFATNIYGNPITINDTVAGDVDGDGFPDIIALAYEITTLPLTGGMLAVPDLASKIAIGYNDGHGGISSIVTAPIDLMGSDIYGNPAVGELQLADVNSDGRLDLCASELTTYDVFGNPVPSLRWRRNPGGGSRNPTDWLRLPLGTMPRGPMRDFNGDGTLEWVDSTGYMRPTPQGPVLSATYNFQGKAYLGYDTKTFAEDFDGDGDADFLIGDGRTKMVLVKNPTVDERSAITRHLVKAGVKGSKAGPGADADGDGRSNEAELLFGTNPESPDSTSSNALAMSLAYQQGGSTLAFRKPAYADDLNLQYEVEHSTNLKDWTPVNGALPTRLAKDASWEHLTLPLSCSGPCGFYRITGYHQIDAE